MMDQFGRLFRVYSSGHAQGLNSALLLLLYEWIGLKECPDQGSCLLFPKNLFINCIALYQFVT
jgi:hypothetical protein